MFVINPYAFGISPLAIPGLTLWLDASDDTTVSTPLGYYTWADKSGNGRDVTAPSAAFDPDYTLSAINGLNAFQYNGANEQLRTAVNPYSENILTSSAYTVLVVMQAEATTDGAVWQANGGTGLTVTDSSGLKARSFNDDGSIDTVLETITISTPTVVTTKLSGGSLFQKINAGSFSSIATGATLTTGGSRLVIGNALSGFAAYNGYIGEVLVYNVALSDASVGSLVTYLREKWGI